MKRKIPIKSPVDRRYVAATWVDKYCDWRERSPRFRLVVWHSGKESGRVVELEARDCMNNPCWIDDWEEKSDEVLPSLLWAISNGTIEIFQKPDKKQHGDDGVKK